MKKSLYRITVYMVVFFMVLSPELAYAKGTTYNVSKLDYIDYMKSVMDFIKNVYNWDVDSGKLLDGAVKGVLEKEGENPLESALKGMFGTMDPFTSYMTLEEQKILLDMLNDETVGIGAEIYPGSGGFVVTGVSPGSSAMASGVRQGDIIVAVDGKSLKGLSFIEVYHLVTGKAGSKVKIKLLRGTANIELSIKREVVNANPVIYDIRDGIGYIKLDVFSHKSANSIEEALTYMNSKNIKKVVLDLRDNPGGDMRACISIAEKFVPKGLILKANFKTSMMESQEFYSTLENIPYKLAVLVNENSASASEALSGAIQDTKAGVLVGTKTYGKAKIQNEFMLLKPTAYKKYKTGLGIRVIDTATLVSEYNIPYKDQDIQGIAHITVGTYSTPSGKVIDEKGIEPDYVVENPQPVNHVDIGEVLKLSKKAKLTQSAKSIDIYYAETILMAGGYDIKTADMFFDEKTRKELVKFQKDSGLHADGILDLATQQALNQKLEALLLEVDTQYAKAVEYLNH